MKLFAKHLKLEEQKVMLKKGCFPIGVRIIGRAASFVLKAAYPPRRMMPLSACAGKQFVQPGLVPYVCDTETRA